jgi:hypothetical protein
MIPVAKKHTPTSAARRHSGIGRRLQSRPMMITLADAPAAAPGVSVKPHGRMIRRPEEVVSDNAPSIPTERWKIAMSGGLNRSGMYTCPRPHIELRRFAKKISRNSRDIRSGVIFNCGTQKTGDMIEITRNACAVPEIKELVVGCAIEINSHPAQTASRSFGTNVRPTCLRPWTSTHAQTSSTSE